MFSSAGSSLRSALLRGTSAFPRPTLQTTRLCSAAAAGAGAGALAVWAQGAPRLGGSIMLGTGVVVAASNLVTGSNTGDDEGGAPRASSSTPWVQQLEANGEECLNPGQVVPSWAPPIMGRWCSLATVRTAEEEDENSTVGHLQRRILAKSPHGTIAWHLPIAGKDAIAKAAGGLNESPEDTLNLMEALVAALVGSSFHQGGANAGPCGGGHQARASVSCSKAINQAAFDQQEQSQQPLSDDEAVARAKLLPAQSTLERLGGFEGLIALLQTIEDLKTWAKANPFDEALTPVPTLGHLQSAIASWAAASVAVALGLDGVFLQALCYGVAQGARETSSVQEHDAWRVELHSRSGV